MLKAAAGITRKQKNEIVKILIPKYEADLYDPHIAKSFKDCYNLHTLEPTNEWLVSTKHKVLTNVVASVIFSEHRSVYYMNTAQRLAKVISFLASTKDNPSITDISRELGISKSVVHSLLTSLCDIQWVAQDSASGKYILGTGVLEICASVMSNMDIKTVSLPFLEKLRSITSETATLVVRVDLESMVLEQLPGFHEILRMTPIGKRLPLWLGSEGRSILAHLPADDIEQVFNKMSELDNLVSASGKSINISNLRDVLTEIRAKGYAVSSGERVLGGSGVAAPIFDRFGRVVGCISATGPLPRFTYEIADQYGSLVKKLSDDISRCFTNVADESIPSSPAINNI